MVNERVTKAMNLLRRQAEHVRENKVNAEKQGGSVDDMPYVMTFCHPETMAGMTPEERAEHDALTEEIQSTYRSG